MSEPRHQLVAGVDIGGTFTDVVVIDANRLVTAKVLSTPEDPGSAVLTGLEVALSRCGRDFGDLDRVLHATTVATNALLERSGERIGLLVNSGFEDVLDIGRQRQPDPFDLHAEKLPPLVERDLVAGVPGRLAADGREVAPVDLAAATDAAHRLADAGVAAIAVCLLHSYANPAHEDAVAAAIDSALGGRIPVFASHGVLPEAREYERASTTAIAAYLAGSTAAYLASLERDLAERGGPSTYWVMKSNGGLTPAKLASCQPHQLVESGPAAGVIGGAEWSRRLGIDDLVAFDMGGTTAKAALVIGGEPHINYDYEVAGRAHAGNFLHKGTGYPLRAPVIDLVEVGTGGGSIAWVDPAGGLRVGPRSAGASPGPAAYGLGGAEPTVTDADVLLGFIDSFPGSDMRGLKPTLAEKAIAELGSRLGLDPEAAAEGIAELANAQMADAVRLVSISRGYDPRELALLATGGAGPVHAWAVARHLGMAQLLIPPYPGVGSALGLLTAPFLVEDSRGVRLGLDADSLPTLRGVADELVASCRATLVDQSVTDPAGIEIRVSLGMRYLGQSYDIDVPAGEGWDEMTLRKRFETVHERSYGFVNPCQPIEITVVRVAAGRRLLEGALPVRREAAVGPGRVRVRFSGRWYESDAVDRSAIDTTPSPGPLLVRQPDTTTVVPPGARVRAIDEGFLLVEMGR